MPIKNRFEELFEKIKSWRHYLHENPELLYEVIKTSDFVKKKLEQFGCDEVVTGLGRTGVVGVIRGRNAHSTRVVGLRADMDALPLQEKTNLDYASKVPGVMHACGHDGHTAMLLGAANYLAETRNFDGTVVLIFQPAEEGGGGAKEMIDDGLMERFGIQEIYGMHNMPGMPVGNFAIRAGSFFAATDTFDLVLEGLGGHAAKPHETVDTTVMSSHLILALQTIASRNADPIDQIVVSVTSVETSSKAYNVIPQNVYVKGTVRTMSKKMRILAEKRISEICDGIASTFGGTIEVTYRRGYPVMVNHEDQTKFAAEVARSVSGSCEEADLVMGGEDFSYLLEERPGAYILVGNGNTAMVHHPMYNFDDNVIPAGCSWWSELIEKRMPAI